MIPRYCSIDLEFTGFDPLADEILEIGFAFFEPTPQGLKITEQWSKVFKPRAEVHPKILGLTGISLDELEAAPLLADFHDELQQKLGDAIIVGHSVSMDARFLEAFGIKLSGKFLDTLELAQFLLPTHHSYNLENLMHFFGVSHSEAHRALADAHATIAVLEKFMRLYQNLPADLKTEMQKLFARHEFGWQALLAYELESNSDMPEHQVESAPVKIEKLSEGLIIPRPFDEITPDNVARGLSSNSLLVIPDKGAVIKLWHDQLAQGVFAPDDLFNSEKFAEFLTHAATPDEIKFALKVLVWQAINWQTKTTLDLNVSFAGGQFVPAVTGEVMEEEQTDKPLVATFDTLAHISEHKLYAGREVVVWNMHEFEHWLASGQRTRLSWNKLSYILKGIYNPETNYGRSDLAHEVVGALAASDLFFGLVNLLAARYFPGKVNITYEELGNSDWVLTRVKQAAENFRTKLLPLIDQVSLPALESFTQRLSDFFDDTSPDHIKWIETGETNCIFFNQPLHVAPLSQKLLQPFAASRFTENIPDPKQMKYFSERLGLAVEPQAESKTGHQPIAKSVQLKHVEQTIPLISGPTVIIFPTLPEVKAFYKSYYLELKKIGRVLAQGYSGGGNKVFRNFGISENSILLATPQFIIRQRHHLPIQTLIFTSLPQLDHQHPYTAALRQYWQPEFPDFDQLQVAYQLYLVLQNFFSPALTQVYFNSAPETIKKYLKSVLDVDNSTYQPNYPQ